MYMKQFGSLAVRHGVRSCMGVEDYDVGDFDLTAFWQGVSVPSGIPKQVKLYVDRGVPCDFLDNPVSWLICSGKLTKILQTNAGDDIEVFPAPLFNVKT